MLVTITLLSFLFSLSSTQLVGPCGSLPCQQCLNTYCTNCSNKGCNTLNGVTSYNCSNCDNTPIGCTTQEGYGGSQVAIQGTGQMVIVFLAVGGFYGCIFGLISYFTPKIEDKKKKKNCGCCHIDIPQTLKIVNSEGEKRTWKRYWKEEHELLSLCTGNFQELGCSERWFKLLLIVVTAFSMSLLFVSIEANQYTITTSCRTQYGWSNSTSVSGNGLSTEKTTEASLIVTGLGLIYGFILGKYADNSSLYGGRWKLFHLFVMLMSGLTLGTTMLVKYLVVGGDLQLQTYFLCFGIAKLNDWLLVGNLVNFGKYYVGSFFYIEKRSKTTATKGSEKNNGLKDKLLAQPVSDYTTPKSDYTTPKSPSTPSQKLHRTPAPYPLVSQPVSATYPSSTGVVQEEPDLDEF